jgi:hypothetical protein
MESGHRFSSLEVGTASYLLTLIGIARNETIRFLIQEVGRQICDIKKVEAKTHFLLKHCYGHFKS